MKLQDFQRQMAADIMRPLTPSDKMSRKSKAAEYVKPNDRLTARERLEIYNCQYWFRILDSLYDDFPGLRAIIGDEAFHRLSRAYLADYPSQSYTMRDLGFALESWLRKRPAYTGGKHALAIDMVRLEWAHIVAFDGPADPLLGPEDLLELGPKLRLRLQPYVSLLDVHYPVDDLRIAISRDPDPHATASNAVVEHKRKATKRRSAQRDAESTFIAVHRLDNSVYYRRLEPEEFRILGSFRKEPKRGEAIGKALEAGFAGSHLSVEDHQTRIANWFAVWAELGWLCRTAK